MTDKNLFELVGTKKPSKSAGVPASTFYAEGDEDDFDGEPSATVRLAPGASAWSEADGRFFVSPRNHARLPAGVYRMELAPQVGSVFVRQKNDTDTLVRLPDSESDAIVAEIRQFKELRSAFREHGFLFKRGYLLWGPPGSGKTCTLQHIIRLLMSEQDAIVVLVEHPGIAASALQALRRVEPERQLVALLEDFDSLCERYDEPGYLSLLDGESQVDNIVYVATTNYPESLDRRFVDRPSRFDSIRYIGMPSAKARAHYLRAKLTGATETQIEQYVAMSEGYSIAHLRELVILTRCFGQPLGDAVARLNFQRFTRPSSETDAGGLEAAANEPTFARDSAA